MPPQLFRRRVRASSPSGEDKDAFDEYKVIMEEIKREHPDLPLSAVQQMTVERFSNKKEKRFSQNNLMAAMSNFRFGRGNKAKEDDPTTNDNDTNEPEDRRRSLNPRVSVKNLDANVLSQSFKEGISSDDEASLANSLENIETSASLRDNLADVRIGTSSLKRASMRSSTDLVDVHEDEELLQAPIPESLAQNTDKTQNRDLNLNATKNSTGSQRSISDDLPEEIKLALEEYVNDDSRRSLGSNDKSEIRRRSRVDESIRSDASSFASIDSANFDGDFSAWGRKSACDESVNVN